MENSILWLVVIIIIVIALVYFFLWPRNNISCEENIQEQLCQVSSLIVQKGNNSFSRISWNPVEGATSYLVRLGFQSNTYVFEERTTQPELFYAFDRCKTYYIVVAAIANGCGSAYSDEVVVDTRLQIPTINSIVRLNNEVTFKWNDVPGALGYRFKWGDKPGMYTQEITSPNPIIVVPTVGNKEIYMIANAFAQAECESPYSKEASYICQAPPKPTGVKVV